MTTYILILLVLIVILQLALLMRRPAMPDLSPLHESNTRLREVLADRLGKLTQNAAELKNISGGYYATGKLCVSMRAKHGCATGLCYTSAVSAGRHGNRQQVSTGKLHTYECGTKRRHGAKTV